MRGTEGGGGERESKVVQGMRRTHTHTDEVESFTHLINCFWKPNKAPREDRLTQRSFYMPRCSSKQYAGKCRREQNITDNDFS